MTDRTPLTAEESTEFARLWLSARVEAQNQGVMLVDPSITGHPKRPLLEALRDGTWRTKLRYD